MTEKKQQSTTQPKQTQGFNSPEEDELDLIDLLKILARKKVFILAITSVCTLFSILYVQSITPIYRASVGLLDHNEKFSSFSVLEQLGLGKVDHKKTKSLNILKRFLFNIESDEFKKKVFVNGGFHKKFSSKTGTDTVQSVSALYNSIKIVRRDPFTNTEFHNGGPFLQLEGSQPKVMLEFLISLVEASKKNVNTEINEIHRSTVKTIINNLSAKIEELHQKITVQKQIEDQTITVQKQMQKQMEDQKIIVQKQIEDQKIIVQKQIEDQKIIVQKQIEKDKKAEHKEKEMVRLSKALDMAKRMGIKNNNFDKPDNGSAPVWFRWGELALQQEIKSLRSKKEEIPNPRKLSIEKAKLKLKKLQQEAKLNLKKLQQGIKSLGSKKEEILKTKKLSLEKLKLKRWQTADIPLLKFKVVTIGEHGYALAKPYQGWFIIGCGVAFGLLISIVMAVFIDLKQVKAKETASAST